MPNRVIFVDDMTRFLHTAGYFIIACIASLLMQGCAGSLGIKHKVEQEILAISSMKELGLVEYRVRKIVKANDEGEWYKIGDRKILLSCTAYLKAGIDLSSFGMDDVSLNRAEGTVTITLPHARLLSIDIPPYEIRHEFDRVSILRSSFTAEERNALLPQGEKQIRESVPSLGILPEAEENGRKFFESVFTRMGFSHVEVIFK